MRLHPVLGGWHKLCGGETFLRAKKRGAPIFGKPVAGLRLSRFCTGFMATLDSVSWRGSPAPFWLRPDPFLLAFYTNRKCSLQKTLFIGPESDHWLCLSLTLSLPPSCLVNLIDVTLACAYAYSKLVEVVIVADVSDEDRVGNSLLQIWKLRFGHKA